MPPERTDLSSSSLERCLDSFRTTFNVNPRVKKLTKGWNRTIFVEATDSEASYSMAIQDLEIASIKPGRVDADEYLVHLQAQEDVLKKIFTGSYNPAHALIDGALAVFSNERDKVKLEAIAMVIWGL